MMPRRQLYLFGATFIVVILLLLFVYFAFMRANYVPLFENVRESDASAIVGELDKQGIEYQLRNDGHDILVPDQDVGKARLALAGSSIALGGVVGFELFNESDMGLTEFAQKINYQRALQGELARTIMAMDGVEFARVHLALPEKSIFRAAQSQPTAAVTIQTLGGRELGPDRVAGIQQLVASSVPDMPLGSVAILNDKGDLLNQVAKVGDEAAALIDEKTALEQYFRARAQTVIKQLIPGLRSEVKVFASRKPQVGAPEGRTVDGTDDLADVPTEQKAPGERDFLLRVLVRTAATLNGEDSSLLRLSIIDALALKPDAGDEISFEVGTLGFTPDQASPLASDTARKRGGADPADLGIENEPLPWLDYILNRWMLLVALVITVVGVLLWRQRQRLNDDEQQSFADMLADGLATQQATRNAD